MTDRKPEILTAIRDGLITASVPYGSSQLNVRIEISGQEINKRHIDSIRKFLDLIAEDVMDAADAHILEAEKSE